MKKVYRVFSLFALVAALSCGNNDTAAGEAADGQEGTDGPIAAGQENVRYGENPSEVIEAYAKDKSGISTADIDLADTSFTMRSKTLYVSDENGKKLTVVYGLKNEPKGVAIIEVEGEKPLKLNQVETPAGGNYEFTNGTVTLTRLSGSVQLDENGEIVNYKEIL